MLEQIDHDDIREIRLARPPVNAIDAPMMLAIHAALEKAADDEVSGVVLSGRQGLFSAGLDIPSLLQLDRQAISEFWRSFFRVLKSLAGFPVPVVAAIGGHNPAGGTVLAIFCDRRIAASFDFRMGLKLGVHTRSAIPCVPQCAIVPSVNRPDGTDDSLTWRSKWVL